MQVHLPGGATTVVEVSTVNAIRDVATATVAEVEAAEATASRKLTSVPSSLFRTVVALSAPWVLLMDPTSS
jgi:hypothetical protein